MARRMPVMCPSVCGEARDLRVGGKRMIRAACSVRSAARAKVVPLESSASMWRSEIAVALVRGVQSRGVAATIGFPVRGLDVALTTLVVIAKNLDPALVERSLRLGDRYGFAAWPSGDEPFFKRPCDSGSG